MYKFLALQLRQTQRRGVPVHVLHARIGGCIHGFKPSQQQLGPRGRQRRVGHRPVQAVRSKASSTGGVPRAVINGVPGALAVRPKMRMPSNTAGWKR